MRRALSVLALLALTGCASTQVAVPALCSACAALDRIGVCRVPASREVVTHVCPAGQRLYVVNVDRLKDETMT